jgi:hypothetical protein
LIIDGWHRIRRAAISGRASLPGYVLTEEETKLVRLSRPERKLTGDA